MCSGFGIERLKEKCTPAKIYALLGLLIFPACQFYLFDGFTHNAFVEMAVKTQFLNLIFYWLLAVFLFALFRRLQAALMVETAFFFLWGLANYYVLKFRAAPIMPWDIYSIKTAATVAGDYDYALEGNAPGIVAGFLILFGLEFFCRWKIKKGRGKFRLALGGAAAVLLCLCVNMVQNDRFIRNWGMYDKLFTPTVMCKRDGNLVAFLMEMEYLKVEKPEDYDSGKIADYLGTWSGGEKPAGLPNIIVIMNEAFSDLSVLGEFETNVDYMPFLHRMQKGFENTRTGTLHVSVLGGNTANTEFEFLTGSSMAFLPRGSVAYQQYVNGEVPSMASYLKELGYETVALHPYNSGGWERDEVYPRLGFDRFLSIGSFYGGKKIRNYYSDETCYKKIISLLERKGENPIFLFNVTMQNHSGYTGTFDNFTPDVTVEGSKSTALNQYLSLLKISDAALENLISYFSEVEEETMIVFFGDHQPTTFVSNPILKQNGKNSGELTEEEQMDCYKVPYLIWANFDIEESSGEEMSVNYLAPEVFELCGLELPPYWQELKKVKSGFPIVTAMQIRDDEGKRRETDEEIEALRFYQQIQYYLLFE